MEGSRFVGSFYIKIRESINFLMGVDFGLGCLAGGFLFAGERGGSGA